MDDNELPILDRFRRRARVLALLVIALGATGITGWTFDIATLKSVLPGLSTMKMNTAASFVVAGTSLLLCVAPPEAPERRWAGRACALLVALAGGLTLLEYALRADFGIDQLLWRAPAGEPDVASPGRMAANTALCFACSGASLALLDAGAIAFRWLSQGLTMLVLLVGFAAVSGYALSVTALYGVPGYSSMAVHTALGFVVMSLGILAARPRFGVVGVLVQDNSAGATARRLLPVILVVPLGIAWLVLRAHQWGHYRTEFALALTVTSSTAIISALALWNARVQGLSDGALRRASDQFRLALEAAPTGMLLVDRAGKIVLLNSHVEALFGYRREELLAKDVEMLVPARLRELHMGHRASFFGRPETRPMGAGGELYGARKDGTEIPVEIALSPLTTPEGTFVLSSILDVTARKRSELERNELLERLRELNTSLERRVEERTAALTSTLREREVLLQEVHHRVKNNLAVIASLMDMQARLLEPGAGREALRDCQSRVHAIALIHEKLYQAKDFGRVPFAAYIRGLASDVFEATGVTRSEVSLVLAVDDVAIPLDKAVPCALVLNELVTNALKHAFPGGRRGRIRVELARTDESHVRLAVSDDGVGLTPGLDVEHSDSLGLRLVTTLAEQLEARLRIQGQGGTSFELTFSMGT